MFYVGQAVRTNWGPGTVKIITAFGMVVDVWGAGLHSMKFEQAEDYPLPNRDPIDLTVRPTDATIEESANHTEG